MTRVDEPSAEPVDSTPTIFIVDDDDGFRRVLAIELRSHGYRVDEATNGAEALEALAAAADGLRPMPDLVVLDVCMPEYSGLGVLGVMQRFEAPPPTLLVTGFVDGSVDVVAGRRGATAIFHKPIELDELVAAVGEALGARSTDASRNGDPGVER